LNRDRPQALASLAVGLFALCAGAGAGGAVHVRATALPLSVVDAISGQPVPGATVAGSESFYWTGFHASGTECFRAASTVLPPAGGDGQLALPETDVKSPRWSDTRHVELFVHHAGYCVDRNAAASWAGFVNRANRENPQGLWGSVPSPKPDETTIVRLLHSEDETERRLRHLAFVARSIPFSCRELGVAPFAILRAAMNGEARAIAKTPYEKFLAAQVDRGWDGQKKGLWLPLAGPASSGDVRVLRVMIENLRKNPAFDGTFKDPLNNSTITYARSGADGEWSQVFEMEGHDESGYTALMNAARAMQPAAVRLLLEQDARADTLTGPDGYSVLDVVLSKAAQDVEETGTEGREIHLLRMVEILVAARPAPTLRAEYREEFIDPQRWTVTPHLREFWMEVRGRVATVQARPPYAAKCAIEEAGTRSLGLTNVRQR
jgi:hypothetical protein